MVTSEFPWTTRAVEPGDAEPWSALYAGYRAFYGLPDDPAAVATTWGWVVGGEHGLHGLVAVDGSGRLGALANLRAFARPSAAGFGVYLDDLYTDPDVRRSGLGGMLLDAAAAWAAATGATLVRWITAESNVAARSVYDAHATATPWVTYDMAPAASTTVERSAAEQSAVEQSAVERSAVEQSAADRSATARSTTTTGAHTANAPAASRTVSTVPSAGRISSTVPAAGDTSSTVPAAGDTSNTLPAAGYTSRTLPAASTR